MTSEVQVLIIVGFGLNCEDETEFAFVSSGARVTRVHLNDLLADPTPLDRHHILALIGGFSFGDHIAAGRAFAARLRYRMEDPLRRFILDGKLVMGICNGFQIMVKLGILPGLEGRLFEQEVTVVHNDSGVFRDAWVRLSLDPESPCVFTRDLEAMDLPIRHGEGKFVPKDQGQLQRILDLRLAPLKYVDPDTDEPTQAFPSNPNGSAAAIAGLCSVSGRLFGMMPHPEAFNSPFNHPDWPSWRRAGRRPERGEGLRLFENAVRFAKREL